MSQKANQPPLSPDSTGPESKGPDSTTTQTSAATGTRPGSALPPRRGVFRWVLIPLAVAGVGFVGYRLGQTAPGQAGSAGTSGGFGAAQGSGRPSGGQAVGGQPGTGSTSAGPTSAGPNSAGANGNSQGSGRQSQQGAGGASREGSAANTNGTRTNAASASGAAGSGRTFGSGRSSVVTPVQAEEAKAGTLTTERRLTGTVSPTQTANVNAQTSGTVAEVLKNVGDDVSAGQAVLTLSNKDLTTSVQSAQNALETAQAQLRSQQEQLSASTASLQQAINSAQLALTTAQNTYAAQQKLYQIGAVSRSELDAQEVQVQQARASLVTAQSNLASTNRTNQNGLTNAQLNVQKAQIALRQAQNQASAARVTAPFDGQVTAVNVAQGQYLGTGTAAFSLVSKQLQVKVNVPATEAAAIPVGAALTLVVGQQNYPLKVTQNTGAASSGSVPVTAKFLDSQPGAGAIGAGTVGSVVYTAKVASGVLVPSTALQVDGTRTYVFTVENGKAKQHSVTVLGQAGTQSALSGIEAGSQVVSQPPTGLLDGGRVTTRAAGSSGQSGAGGPPPGGMP